MPTTDSPLRYPGGKTQLAPLVIDLMRANGLFYGGYAEPFAGGCGIAWRLLLANYVTEIHINDLDRPVYAFWSSVLRQSEALCDRIRRTRVSMAEWHRQRAVLLNRSSKILDLGFATFFLNRTNRSGIINGGVIGGLSQDGDYLLDCRFNKLDLVNKIERIALHREQISLTQLDGEEFLRKRLKALSDRILVNIDPPYYAKGPGLYMSSYVHEDHVRLAAAVGRIKQPWLVTYDDVPEIRALYRAYKLQKNPLQYFAQEKRIGVELLVVDPRLRPAATVLRA